jgi:hypothetical protein
MIVMGLIEVQDGRLFNTAIVVERGAVFVAISNLNSGRHFRCGAVKQQLRVANKARHRRTSVAD